MRLSLRQERPSAETSHRDTPVLLASEGEPRLLDVPGLDAGGLGGAAWLAEPALPLDELDETSADDVSPSDTMVAGSSEAALARAEAMLEALDATQDDEPSNDADPSPAPLDALDDTLIEEEHFGRRLAEREVVLELAENCLVDLATLGRMRAPAPELGWTDGDESERRLLTRIDAILACGIDVLAELRALESDRPVPDAEMVWALMMLYGSISSDHAVDVSMEIAEIAPLDDDDMRLAVVDAWSLAPHPRIDHVLRGWLGSGDAARHAVAIDALSLRRTLVVEDVLSAIQSDDVAVVRAGARAMGRLTARLDPAPLVWLLDHEDEGVLRGALESAVALGVPEGLRRAEGLCRAGMGAFADAAQIAAIAGTERTLGALLEDAATGGSATTIHALGWFGSLECVEYLLGRLSSKEDDVRLAARAAIHRIAGRGPDTDEATSGPLVTGERRSDSRSSTLPPPPVGKRPLAATWKSWWQTARARARRDVRYRFGQPWSAASVVRELQAPSSLVSNRRWAHLELLGRTSGRAPLDLHHFVSRQRTQLRALAREVRTPSGSGWATRLAGC